MEITIPAFLKFFILSFLSLFALVNPIGLAPVYISLVDHVPMHLRRGILVRAIITATVILFTFTLLGRVIFTFFGITIDAFRIVGGILFFRVGMSMLEAKVSRMRSTPKETEEAQDRVGIAYTPLGIPIIAGPGAITSVMILSSEAVNWIDKISLLFTILSVMLLTYIIFQASDLMTKKFGTTGLRIMQRIMGLILMVIAVQFIVNGTQPIVTGWIRDAISSAVN